MNSTKGISRRKFIRSVAGGIAATSVSSSLMPQCLKAHAGRVGLSDKVRIAVIGCGGMGSRHIEELAVNPNCALLAVCDVFTPRYEAAQKVVEGKSGRKPDGYQDYREVLDRNDIDAIFVPTPDNWHPLITIHGCQAGKDVYVEKPACPTVVEGRKMIETARRYGRIVQLGTQQRSMPVFQKAIEVIHSGKLGKITTASAWIGPNQQSIDEIPGPIPEGLDWDLWLGPAPFVPYSPQRHFGFMGWHDYCRGGQLTNWGVHLMDIVHWGIQQDKPLSVQAVGGTYVSPVGSDDEENIDVLFEYPGCTVTWEQRHWNIHGKKGYGVKFQGTEGQLWVDRSSYSVQPLSLGIEEYVGEPETSWANPEHHNNFFSCVRTRQRPVAEIEQGVRSTIPVLLAGIAIKERRKLVWDGDNETFLHDEQANRYLSRSYRAPWHL